MWKSEFIRATCSLIPWGGPLPILSLYSIVICVVAAVLYVAVNEHEPNRRLAFALKMFIVILVVAAIVHHWMR